MDSELPGDVARADLTMVELLRLAQVHQQVAHGLVARAERISHTGRPPARKTMAAWGLSERESHVAALLSSGMSNRSIARSLTISERTVKNHLHSIFAKLGVTDRTQAVITLMRAETPGQQDGE